MSRGVLLLPNLGGEEGPGWRAALREPRIATAANLWRQLFAPDARFPTEIADLLAGMPGGLPREIPRDRPAFDWLGTDGGCVAWLGDDAAADAAARASLPLRGPAPRIVLRVHDKAFAHQAASDADLVPRALVGTTRVFDAEALDDADRLIAAIESALGSWPPGAGRRFTLKPRLGSSGRGRFDATGGAIDTGTLRRALPRLSARGGALLEPWLDRTSDVSTQLRVGESGDVVLLGTVSQILSRPGTYLGHRGEIDSRGRVFSGHRQDEAVREAAARIAGAAGREGYFGPCGVDSLTFVWRDEAGEREILRPVVELNARFTMGTVVVGLVRRSLPAVRESLGLRPGDRGAFAFRISAPPGGWEAARLRAGGDALLVRLDEAESSARPVAEPALLFAPDGEGIDRALAGPTRDER